MENDNIIEVTGHLTDSTAMRINDQLRNLESKGKIRFELAKLQFVKPYGMLFLAQSIRELKDRYSSEITVNVPESHPFSFDEPIKDEVGVYSCGYMAHVGFFEDIGIEYGKEPGEARGSSTYIPITKISCQESHDFLEVKAEALAKILFPDDQAIEYRKIFQYVIFEALRNAIEHSESDCVRICGQSWYDGTAEIAILDNGIGVLGSLKENTLYSKLNSERDALKKAVEAGVSRSLISKRNDTNIMANSGYGLYMLKRICKESGSLLLVSNGATLKISKDKDDVEGYSEITGTSLKIEINLNELLKLGNLHKILARYRNESKSPVPPSASSMATNIK